VASPFDRLLRGIEGVPQVFRDEFLVDADVTDEALLEGRMAFIRFPRLLTPVMWVLGRLGVLAARRGNDVPSVVRVTAQSDASGRPLIRFERTFQFERSVRFDSSTVWDEDRQQLVDLVGPGGFLRTASEASYEAGRLRFRSTAIGMALRGRTFWVPEKVSALLCGRILFVQQASHQEADNVVIALKISHPLLGEVFAYRGRFTVRPVLSSVQVQSQNS
jgi:hypothetical protein